MYEILFYSRQDTGAGRRRGNSGWTPATSKTGFRVGHCLLKLHGASPSLDFFFTVLWPSPWAFEEGGGERWIVTWNTKEVPYNMYPSREMNSGRVVCEQKWGDGVPRREERETGVSPAASFHSPLRPLRKSDGRWEMSSQHHRCRQEKASTNRGRLGRKLAPVSPREVRCGKVF